MRSRTAGPSPGTLRSFAAHRGSFQHTPGSRRSRRSRRNQQRWAAATQSWWSRLAAARAQTNSRHSQEVMRQRRSAVSWLLLRRAQEVERSQLVAEKGRPTAPEEARPRATEREAEERGRVAMAPVGAARARGGLGREAEEMAGVAKLVPGVVETAWVGVETAEAARATAVTVARAAMVAETVLREQHGSGYTCYLPWMCRRRFRLREC